MSSHLLCNEVLPEQDDCIKASVRVSYVMYLGSCSDNNLYVKNDVGVISNLVYIPKEYKSKANRTCEHNKAYNNCSICSNCGHDCVRRRCYKCSSCMHGVIKYTCRICKRNKIESKNKSSKKTAVCSHKVSKKTCTLCKCIHGYKPYMCKVCNNCGHDCVKHSCKVCSGCEHGILHRACKICNDCGHGKLERHCLECRGCQHGVMRSWCKECKSSAVDAHIFTSVIQEIENSNTILDHHELTYVPVSDDNNDISDMFPDLEGDVSYYTLSEGCI